MADGLFHPFLADPVPNALALGPAAKLIFLTGPNMAGKTTYLRTCAVAAYLAHLGMTVPAVRMCFAPFDALITAIDVADDLRAGISFFQAEARRVRDVAASLAEGKRALVVLDEMFKGTNVKDAKDATLRVLRRFAGSTRSRFMISSHLAELADDLATLPGLAFRRFEATEAAGRLRFDYAVKEGVSDQRLGLRVLQQEGVFDLLDRVP